jgi:hypothetical protein
LKSAGLRKLLTYFVKDGGERFFHGSDNECDVAAIFGEVGTLASQRPA